MEIPGLTRLRSASVEVQENDTKPAAAPAQIEQSAIKSPLSAGPTINADLQAKIEALRVQARQRAPSTTQTSIETVGDGALAGTPSAQSGVNYSILDSVLERHGFGAIPDSDEEMMMEESDGSDDSSEDSSDSDDDDDDDDSDDDSDDETPLTAEERERILIAADGDEGPTTNEIPRTKNEVAEDEEPVRIPDFEISANEHIEPLGTVTSVVGAACVVTGTPTPETKVLDVGSLLVFDDRKNLGYIADTFGPVILPMFTVRFKSVDDMTAANVQPGRQVFFVPKHAVFVFSDTLRVKGTDASNIHDEEQSETEFSDDEQEALYKSRKKQQRKAEKQGGFVPQREARPLNDLESIALAQGLTFDSANSRVQQHCMPQPHEVGAQTFSPPANIPQRQQQRGRGGNRGSRGTGRGRPETNNYGRGPDVGRQYPDANTSTPVAYQRTFYQPAPSVPVPGPQSHIAEAPTPHPTPAKQASTPTLYQPLKRPT